MVTNRLYHTIEMIAHSQYGERDLDDRKAVSIACVSQCMNSHSAVFRFTNNSV